MKQSQLIAKNIVASGSSTAIAGVLQLAIIILVARNVSVAEFGAYSFMLAFAFIVLRIADGGLSIILTRDLAVESKKILEVLGATLGLAWVMSLGAMLLMAAVVPFFHFDRRLSILIALMGIEGLTQFICGCHGAVLRSQEDYETTSLGFVLHKVVALVLVIVAFVSRTGLEGVVAAHLIGSITQWWFYRWKVIRDYGRPRMRLDWAQWRYLIRESVPVGAANVVRLLAEQADIMILALMAGTTAVGLFSGPYKIAAGLRFLPQALILPLIPFYSRAAVADGERADFRDAYGRSVKSFMLLGLPLAVLFLLAPRPLTAGLLGANFIPAISVTRLLSIGILLIFFSTPFPYLLTAYNRQRFLFVTSTCALGIRVALDLLFVRRFNFIAPCLSLIVSESLLNIVWIARFWAEGFRLDLLDVFWRPCAAAIVMGAIIRAFGSNSLLTLAPIALVAGLVYLAIVLKLGGVSPAEMTLLREGAESIGPWLGERFNQALRRAS